MLCQAWAARKALIIGNGAYSERPLRNAVNDAWLMERTLESIGFDTVSKFDRNYEEMLRAIIEFSDTVESSDEVFFYYSGHAIQIKDSNYLIPVRETILDLISAQCRSISLKEDVMERLERAKFLIIVLDSCRDNPFSGTRGASRGLAKPPAPQNPYFILYSTSANDVAQDGSGDNSDFTRILCKNMLVPNVEISEMGRRVGKEVSELFYLQNPEHFGRYYDNYYLIPPETVWDVEDDYYYPTEQVPAPPKKDYEQRSDTYVIIYQPTYQANDSINRPKPVEPNFPSLPSSTFWPLSDPDSSLDTDTELALMDSRLTKPMVDNAPIVNKPPAPKKEPRKPIHLSISAGSLSEAKLRANYSELSIDSGLSESYIQFQYRKLWFRQSYNASSRDENYPQWIFHLGIPLYFADLEVGLKKDHLPYYSTEYYVDAMLKKIFNVEDTWTILELGGYLENKDYPDNYQEANQDFGALFTYGTPDDIFLHDNRINLHLDNYGKGVKGQFTITNADAYIPSVGLKNYQRNAIPLLGQDQNSIILNLACDYEYIDYWASRPSFRYDYALDRLELYGGLASKLQNNTELDLFFKRGEYKYSEYNSQHPNPYTSDSYNRYLYSGLVYGGRLSQTIHFLKYFNLVPSLGIICHDVETTTDDYLHDQYSYHYFPLELLANISSQPYFSIDAKLGWEIDKLENTITTLKTETPSFYVAFALRFKKGF